MQRAFWALAIYSVFIAKNRGFYRGVLQAVLKVCKVVRGNENFLMGGQKTVFLTKSDVMTSYRSITYFYDHRVEDGSVMIDRFGSILTDFDRF